LKDLGPQKVRALKWSAVQADVSSGECDTAGCPVRRMVDDKIGSKLEQIGKEKSLFWGNRNHCRREPPLFRQQIKKRDVKVT